MDLPDLPDRSGIPGDDAPHLLVVDDDTRIRKIGRAHV